MSPSSSAQVLSLENQETETYDLLEAIKSLSRSRDVSEVTRIVGATARRMIGADGATIVLRDGDEVHYVDEDAIEPLWKGRRFPASRTVSGWAITQRRCVAIPDVYAMPDEPWIPCETYRSTFVKGLAMVPIGNDHPSGAIGVYWAAPHRATGRELELIQILAETTAVAFTNLDLFLKAKRAMQAESEFISRASHELNTPLTALNLQIDLLQRHLSRDLDQSDKTQYYQMLLTKAAQQRVRLAQALDQLLGAFTKDPN